MLGERKNPEPKGKQRTSRRRFLRLAQVYLGVLVYAFFNR